MRVSHVLSRIPEKFQINCYKKNTITITSDSRHCLRFMVIVLMTATRLISMISLSNEHLMNLDRFDEHAKLRYVIYYRRYNSINFLAYHVYCAAISQTIVRTICLRSLSPPLSRLTSTRRQKKQQKENLYEARAHEPFASVHLSCFSSSILALFSSLDLSWKYLLNSFDWTWLKNSLFEKIISSEQNFARNIIFFQLNQKKKMIALTSLRKLLSARNVYFFIEIFMTFT